MVEIVVLGSILLLILAVAFGNRSSRYKNMTEEEFNEEAERATLRGAGVAEFQRFVDPSHKVEYLRQRDKHVEAEEADSGDGPETSEPAPSQASSAPDGKS